MVCPKSLNRPTGWAWPNTTPSTSFRVAAPLVKLALSPGTTKPDSPPTLNYRLIVKPNDLCPPSAGASHSTLVQTKQSFRAYYPEDDQKLQNQAVSLQHPDQSHPLTVVGMPCHKASHSGLGPTEPEQNPGAPPPFNAAVERLIHTFGLSRKKAGTERRHDQHHPNGGCCEVFFPIRSLPVCHFSLLIKLGKNNEATHACGCGFSRHPAAMSG